MQEDFNYKCNHLKSDIENLMTDSELPIAVIYFIIKDIYNDIEKFNISYLNSLSLNESEKLQQKLDHDIETDIQNNKNIQMVSV